MDLNESSEIDAKEFTGKDDNLAASHSKPRKRVRFFTLFLIGILLSSVIFSINFRTVIVKGKSMNPTLLDGRKVLVCKAFWLVGKIKKGDIVVCEEATRKDYFIKRVYGLPGDRIDWAFAPADYDISKGPFIVPEGKIYLVGDNLLHSDDSRKFGPFEQSRLLGKVLTW